MAAPRAAAIAGACWDTSQHPVAPKQFRGLQPPLSPATTIITTSSSPSGASRLLSLVPVKLASRNQLL
eukprot:6178072-Pleurochrysis_carterae.AAC.1